jgi:tetratricopeptide (TPR) repeat protein
MVGRHAEINLFQLLLRQALDGHGQVLTVTGAPGIGKSRFAAEAGRLAHEFGFDVTAAACHPDARGIGYFVWQPIWRGIFGLNETASAAEQQAALTAWLAQAMPDAAERMPLLAPVLGLSLPESMLTAALQPKTRAALRHSLLLDCLRAAAADIPRLLVLDDCQWIDEASQALLKVLARSLYDQRVLLLAAARPPSSDAGPFASLSRLANCADHTLEALQVADAERLLRERWQELRGPSIPPPSDLTCAIVERAAGNPLHLEELTRFVAEQDLLADASASPAAAGLPSTLARLVLARVDRLPELERATLEAASVIGQRFPASWVWQSQPELGTAAEVGDCLARLDAAGLITLQPSLPRREYEFAHSLVHEVVYESLAAPRREQLHEAVASFIERAHTDDTGRFAMVLARHYARTTNAAKQRQWFLAAASVARADFANEAAAEIYERLLPLLPGGKAAEVLIELGTVRQLGGSWAAAKQAYHQAIRLAGGSGRRQVVAAGKRQLGTLFVYTHSYDQALAWLTEAAAEFERLHDPEGLARTLDRLAFALLMQGSYAEAAAASERHLSVAGELGDSGQLAAALDNLGLVRWRTGEHAEARELLVRALQVASQSGNQEAEIHAANDLAGLCHERGEREDAVAYLHRALLVAQQIGYRHTVGVTVGNAGELYREHGDLNMAARCFAYALGVAVELGDWTSMASWVDSLGTVAAAQGRHREANQLLSRAVLLARKVNDPYMLSDSLFQLARLHASQGRFEEALQLNQEALAIASSQGERDDELRSRVLSLRLGVALGRSEPHEALQELRHLRDQWEGPQEQALILMAVWELDPSQEAARDQAAALYATLYEQAERAEYREAYQRLTGEPLPVAPALPPLPVPLDPGVDDPDELVRQVDVVMGQALGDLAVAS